MTELVATAMLLAAGRGERMRPLTDHTPKPLLPVGGQPLIEHHLQKLAKAGFERVIINHARLGEQIVSAVGDGSRWGLEIRFSAEQVALETAGGIANALCLIDCEAFAVINSDVYSDYDYARLSAAAQLLRRDPGRSAHLVLVDNPAHNRAGDFALEDSAVVLESPKKLTFSGLAAYRADMFANLTPGEKKPLGPMLRIEAQAGRVSGEHFRGYWTDVGTPDRLAYVNKLLARGRT
jgi:MurNAc alpha-1-phosphate uridylyltransferase